MLTGLERPGVGDSSRSFGGRTGSFGAGQISILHILLGCKKLIGPLYSSFSHVCVPYAGFKKPSAFPSICLDQLALNLDYQVHDLSLCTFCIHCMLLLFLFCFLIVFCIQEKKKRKKKLCLIWY